MIIDFHTHSHASDGALSPQELLAQAGAAGISEFALTDHDTVAGYRLLLQQELPADLTLVAGVELSCEWGGATIHVLGLGMDIDNAQFVAGLAQLSAGRQERAQIIAARLEKVGMPGALEGAIVEAGESQLGRPHFAAWMVAQGHVSDINSAFDKYLGAGKLGDVKTCWPKLAEVVSWIVDAGGSAILAHPLKYKFTRSKLRRMLADLVAAGGAGMEVLSGRQQPDQTADLCKLARELDLLGSVGSDFHQEYQYGAALGVDIARLPADMKLWRAGTQT